MASVRELLDHNEDQAIAKLCETLAPLKLSPGAHKKLISMFKSAFSPSVCQESEIMWEHVKPLTEKEQFRYEDLPNPEIPAHDLLNQLVVCKLNGGLGTTMGCTCPKSLIICQNNQTFFDLTIQQIRSLNEKYNTNVPLILMQSFYTDTLMNPVVEEKRSSGVGIFTFTQNKFPRIYEKTLEPVPQSADSPINEWNPPGHADVFHCLRDSGLLEKLLAAGKKYLFISNIDNLGATVNLKILNKVVSEARMYAAETVPKTPDDWKGGMPILYKGKVKLLETAQVPPGHMKDFCNTEIFGVFNANNMWVSLEELKRKLDSDSIVLDVIKNRKQLAGEPVVQLEAASGSAIQSFEDAISINMPRRRYIPVKSCSDLLIMRSDVYVRDEDLAPYLNPARGTEELPHIELASEYYTTVDAFERRFPHPVSLVRIRSLVVAGDVTFGKNVVLEGDVVFQPPAGEKWTIPDGRVYRNIKVTMQSQL